MLRCETTSLVNLKSKSYLVFSVGIVQFFIGQDSRPVSGPDLLEQPFGFCSGGESGDQSGTLPSPQQGDHLGMAAKVLNVPLDPLQGRDDVAEAVVARVLGVLAARQRVQRQEPEHSSPNIGITRCDE